MRLVLWQSPFFRRLLSHQATSVNMESLQRLLSVGGGAVELLMLAKECPPLSQDVVSALASLSPLLPVVCAETGGILLHNAFLRVLGGGCQRLPRSALASSVDQFDAVPSSANASGTGVPPAIIVADDVVGGIFAVNMCAFSGVAVGTVLYLCPEGLQWDALGVSYDRFLRWAVNEEAFLSFYSRILWLGWEQDAKNVGAENSFAFDPPLCTSGAAQRTKSVVPAKVMYDTIAAMMGAAFEVAPRIQDGAVHIEDSKQQT